MDSTLLTILLLLAFATVLALIRARKRDKCLKDFEGFHITLAEKTGDLTWGHVRIFTTGLEITYIEPVVAPQGHLERSFIFYKDQYEAMHALYRYPEGLAEAAQMRRARVIRHTARPGLFRRLMRQVSNWIGMVRDALVQAVGLVIGAAKTQASGTAVLSSQEPQFTSLSSEIIGHVGNAYDPLLETHLFTEVVVELTRKDCKYSYCGWLKDYTSRFIEVVDASANTTEAPLPLQGYRPNDARCEGVKIWVDEGRLCITNETEQILHVQHVEAGRWSRPMGCVLSPTYTADLVLPPDVDVAALLVWVGAVDRFDVVVPRTHALVRHAANGSGETSARRRIPFSLRQANPAQHQQDVAA